jgi:fumarate reductase subunit D
MWGLFAGICTVSAWASWVIMLGIGALASLGVVNETVSFHEATPLGVGFVGFVFLPLLLFVGAVSD